MAFDPDSGIGVLVSTNSISGVGVERVLSNAILKAAMYEKTGELHMLEPDFSLHPVDIAVEELKEFEGIYALAGESNLINIAIAEDDTLYINNITGVPFPLGLQPLSDGSFVNPETGLRVWFEELFDQMVLFFGDNKTHLIGARLDPEHFLANEGFERWAGTYVPHVEAENHVSIVSATEVGIDENGFAFIRMHALHGHAPINPMARIDNYTYSIGGIPVRFSTEGGAAWVTLAGATFVRVPAE
jgi:hypothetical protein